MAKAEYRSAIRSRKMINMALADLLQEKPLDKITVTDVVRQAGLNRGTFYAHYTDIPDVINHIIEQIFSKIRDEVFEPPENLSDIPHVLVTWIEKILETDYAFCSKVMTSSASPLMEDQLVRLLLDYLIQNEDRFAFGQRERYVLSVRFCAGGLASLYRDWFSGKIPLKLEELTRQAEILLDRIIEGGEPTGFAG